MMTHAEIRRDFFQFFEEKKHTLVKSDSLLPSSPNLLFTNAGMNQFVPYFLGAEKAPYDPPRAVDTQKCIRAGGKHNDLEDVGYDGTHHTFFEMLGNWSFGDYFKQEAIAWAWELIVERWKFPPERLYATVYCPEEGDPGEFDQESYDLWAQLFSDVGLDPSVHVVNGNKKDNFWMMGETGPCGPCSELHIDLTEKGDSKGALVNADDPRCIEFWNLVFIQYNAEESGAFRPLTARHVDTGMGFERVCALMQCTKGFTRFDRLISNYDSDVFAPLFAKLKELTGISYEKNMPSHRAGLSQREQQDIALRVLADHARLLCFTIADGILPGNTGRNYVVRRILRRAVRYARLLGGPEANTLLSSLAPVVISHFGEMFPELMEHRQRIIDTIKREEDSFAQTLDRGLRLFEDQIAKLSGGKTFPAQAAFTLYDTYGFPIDLTQLMLEERGLTCDWDEVQQRMDEQRTRARSAQKKEIIQALDHQSAIETTFTGYQERQTKAQILEVIQQDGKIFLLPDRSPFYAEMGGQVGDTGTVQIEEKIYPVSYCLAQGKAHVLQLADPAPTLPSTPFPALLSIDETRRSAIEAHHTATHLLHWALHESVSQSATQQGSYVGQQRLRFDFSSDALSPEQIEKIESLVNDSIAQNHTVHSEERPFDAIKDRADIMQFFGAKYGDTVRVVQIGGEKGALNGYSMELCAGTHVQNTNALGAFWLKSESAISAGIRRIEAFCGTAAKHHALETIAQKKQDLHLAEKKLSTLREKIQNSEKTAHYKKLPHFDVAPFVHAIEQNDFADPSAITLLRDGLLDLDSQLHATTQAVLETEKFLKKQNASQRAQQADAQLDEWLKDSPPHLIQSTDAPELLQELLNGLKKRTYPHVAVLSAIDQNTAHLAVFVGNTAAEKFHAGKLLQTLLPTIDGRGGGKQDLARGAGKNPKGIEKTHALAKELIEGK